MFCHCGSVTAWRGDGGVESEKSISQKFDLMNRVNLLTSTTQPNPPLHTPYYTYLSTQPSRTQKTRRLAVTTSYDRNQTNGTLRAKRTPKKKHVFHNRTTAHTTTTNPPPPPTPLQHHPGPPNPHNPRRRSPPLPHNLPHTLHALRPQNPAPKTLAPPCSRQTPNPPARSGRSPRIAQMCEGGRESA